MPDNKLSDGFKSVLEKRASASTAYYRSKLALAEANEALLRQSVKDGIVDISDIVNSYR